MKRFILAALSVLLVISCKNPGSEKQVDEGRINNNTYSSKEIGWTMNIPTNGWLIVTSEEASGSSERGLEAVEETVGEKVDMSQLKNLIGYKKDEFNNFQSTSEPFKEEFPGEWSVNNNQVKQIIYNTYLSQGIAADSSVTTTELVDGLEFKMYSFSIRSKDGTVILNQIIYGRFINGYDFGANINYNNEKDKLEMLTAWRNSKFTKR